MSNSPESLFEQWHPVAAMEDVRPGQHYETRLLGRTVRYMVSAENLPVAVWSMADGEQQMSAMLLYGSVWLSFSARPDAMFQIPEFDEPDRRILSTGSVRLNVSGLRAVENFLDMAHFPFVHTDILGAEPLTEVLPYKVRIDQETNEIIATECRFAQPKASATADKPIEAEYIYRVARPYVAILYKTCVTEAGRWDVICLFVQPMEEEWCVAHTILCCLDDINSDAVLRRFQQTIFGQDLMILLNQVPKRLPLAAGREVPVKADVLGTTYRRWLRESDLQFGALRD